MMVLSAKLNATWMKAAVIAAALLILFGAGAVFFCHAHTLDTAAGELDLRIRSKNDAYDRLVSLGYDAERAPAEDEIVIPPRANAVYEDYLRLQDSQSLSLRAHLGEKATRYVFQLKDGAVAEMLVCGTELCAAHRCENQANAELCPLLTPTD